MKLIALDLDGTLTNSQKQITPRTRQTIIAAQERGVRVILASGRPPCGQRHLAEELQLSRYGGFILAFNGGQLIECATQHVIDSITIPHSLLPDIIQQAESARLDILSYQGDTMFSTNAQNTYVQYAARINRMEVHQANPLIDALPQPVPKCIIVGEPSLLEPFESQLKEVYEGQLHIVRSEPFFLEVMPSGVDKAQRLDFLLHHIGASREDLIAFGDGYNDENMIRYAGIGVAMGNACPPVKEAADYVTLSNDEDGVAHALERFIS